MLVDVIKSLRETTAPDIFQAVGNRRVQILRHVAGNSVFGEASNSFTEEAAVIPCYFDDTGRSSVTDERNNYDGSIDMPMVWQTVALSITAYDRLKILAETGLPELIVSVKDVRTDRGAYYRLKVVFN
jgi:hypothetical protein